MDRRGLLNDWVLVLYLYLAQAPSPTFAVCTGNRGPDAGFLCTRLTLSCEGKTRTRVLHVYWHILNYVLGWCRIFFRKSEISQPFHGTRKSITMNVYM